MTLAKANLINIPVLTYNEHNIYLCRGLGWRLRRLIPKYETLLDLVENTAGDSLELYYGLFMYNKNAMEQFIRLVKNL